MYACTTGDPRIADVLLCEIQPGDLLRVTGRLVQPDDPQAPACFTVDGLEVLEAAPAPVVYGQDGTGRLAWLRAAWKTFWKEGGFLYERWEEVGQARHVAGTRSPPGSRLLSCSAASASSC
ncbi:hypothetical protein [Streptomyces lavendulocolor]|uniref:hypothetical protein n=1 Tax=Streptomyces lavendulocolor TaxID=67316 RepID=UPI003C30584B